jgi:hypothetical protein
LEQRSPRGDRDEQVRRRRARPRGGHPLQLVAILEVDAVLAPRLPSIYQLELAATQRVKRMSDLNERLRTARSMCS